MCVCLVLSSGVLCVALHPEGRTSRLTAQDSSAQSQGALSGGSQSC